MGATTIATKKCQRELSNLDSNEGIARQLTVVKAGAVSGKKQPGKRQVACGLAAYVGWPKSHPTI